LKRSKKKKQLKGVVRPTPPSTLGNFTALAIAECLAAKAFHAAADAKDPQRKELYWKYVSLEERKLAALAQLEPKVLESALALLGNTEPTSDVVSP